jgi:hypothetical protein
MRYLKFMVYVIIIMFIIIIIVENHDAFATKLWFKLDLNIFSVNYRTAEITIYNITAIAFLSGVLITGIFGMAERFRLKGQIKDLYKIIKDKDKELNSLRNLPITSDLTVNFDDIIK